MLETDLSRYFDRKGIDAPLQKKVRRQLRRNGLSHPYDTKDKRVMAIVKDVIKRSR